MSAGQSQVSKRSEDTGVGPGSGIPGPSPGEGQPNWKRRHKVLEESTDTMVQQLGGHGLLRSRKEAGRREAGVGEGTQGGAPPASRRARETRRVLSRDVTHSHWMLEGPP